MIVVKAVVEQFEHLAEVLLVVVTNPLEDGAGGVSLSGFPKNPRAWENGSCVLISSRRRVCGVNAGLS